MEEAQERIDDRSTGSVKLAASDTSAIKAVPTEDLCEELFGRLEAVENGQIMGRLLGQLRTRLSLITDCAPNRYSTIKARQLLAVVRGHPYYRDDLVAGRSIVEFGCGGINPLAGHLAFAALGARKCTGLDLEAPNNPELAARSMFEVAAEMLLAPNLFFAPASPGVDWVRKNLEGIDFQRLRGGDLGGLPSDRFQMLQASGAKTGLETNTTDMCVSVSFLEHVDDIDAVIAETARLTPPGRLGVHLIDGADHRSYWNKDYDSLQFLTEEPGGHHYTGCNRIRPRHFIERFEAHGFTVVEFQTLRTHELPSDFRARLVPPFAEMSDEDLSVIDAIAYVVKR